MSRTGRGRDQERGHRRDDAEDTEATTAGTAELEERLRRLYALPGEDGWPRKLEEELKTRLARLQPSPGHRHQWWRV